MTTVAKAEYNGKARFGIVEAQQQNEVHYGEVPQSICCGVTLFHPHPYGADPRVSSAKPDVPPVGTGFWS